VCEEFGIQPALSICSRFILRDEMFWRVKLSALSQALAWRSCVHACAGRRRARRCAPGRITSART
jgi:hypothetical protein